MIDIELEWRVDGVDCAVWRNSIFKAFCVYGEQRYAIAVKTVVIAFYSEHSVAVEAHLSLCEQLHKLGIIAAFLGLSPVLLEVRRPVKTIEVC